MADFIYDDREGACVARIGLRNTEAGRRRLPCSLELPRSTRVADHNQHLAQKHI
jgi:hypothetical protein